MIEIKQLRKSYGENKVLNNIDLSVLKGEVVVLLGASGSGKTTLLRCINFLEKADNGIIRIADQIVDLKTATIKEILQFRRKTAMVFQNYDLFLNKNVLENVMEGLVTARKIPKTTARGIALDMLEKVGLIDKLTSKPYQLSGGQQQRVGIARALAINPLVILFDEPTSSLDPEKVDEILEVIRDVADLGVTMVIATHEMEFAFEIADKIVFIDGGEIIEEGPPKKVFGNPEQDRTRKFLLRFTSTKQPEYFI
jgi:L-cystine transport system ATP-binding protein